MSRGRVLILVLLLSSLIAGAFPSLGASGSGDNGQTKGTGASVSQMNGSDQHGLTSTGNGAAVDTSADTSAAVNLKYIWSISGIEKDQITLALDQAGDDIFGKAKYEPENGEPWNGVVAGSVKGDRVHIAIAAMKDGEVVSTVMDGLLADGAISGKFFQASVGMASGSGEFNAVSINPDLSAYVPARVNASSLNGPVRGMSLRSANATDVSATSAPNQIALQASMQKSRFHDVHLDADRIQTGVGDISQIPIGMG